MFEVKITRDFSAAHRVEDYPGNCEKLHGHNWKVEIIASAPSLDPLGMVMDFRKLKEIADEVLAPLDHAYLNEAAVLHGLNPTAENIARHIFSEVSKRAPVSRVNVFETESSVASYFEG